jgi:hypothetical protein
MSRRMLQATTSYRRFCTFYGANEGSPRKPLYDTDSYIRLLCSSVDVKPLISLSFIATT